MPSRPLRLDPGRLDRAFARVGRHVQSGVAGYAALAVGSAAGAIRIEAFGRNGTIEEPHRSPIASITKPITAVAVLQLVEAGDVVLHEPLSTYLPELGPTARPDDPALDRITPWHLLTHTSGLADLDLAWYAAAPRTPRDVVAELCRATPEFAPGSAYRYATDTFHLLAEIVRRISGRPFREFLRDRLFEPLRMPATSFDPDELGSSVAIEGTFAWPGMSQSEVRDVFRTLEIPGGGLWSTPEDVLRFGRAMLSLGTLDGARVLGEPFVKLMLRRHTAGVVERGTGRSPNYGLGWGFPGLGRGTPASAETFAHTGSTGSILLVDPAYDLVVVHLRNDWGATMLATDEVLQLVYGARS